MGKDSYIIVTCPCGAGFRGRGRGSESYNQALHEASLQFLGHLGEHSLDMGVVDTGSPEGIQNAIANLASFMPDVQFNVR